MTRILHIFLVAFFWIGIQSISANNAFSQVDNKKENFTDDDGKRQGYWRITGAMSIEEGYKKGDVLEEGAYVDNKREGLWKKYFPMGSLKSEINYEANRPYGYYKIYYPEGGVEEEGYWKGNKNTGSFVRYHDNGKKAQEFEFNSKGKRTGEQKYYFENGKPQMTVEVDNGIAHGMQKIYYPNGRLKEERRVVNGKIDEDSIIKHKSSRAIDEDIVYPDLPASETKPATYKTNLAEFKESGFNTLYNKNQQLSQVGEFLDGRLWKGKWYRYDENGILKKVEVYRDGRFVGYGIIDESEN